MATWHNKADLGQISETVLLPGDPLRAKYIADKYLKDAVLFNDYRLMYGYSGYYKDKWISVMATGMGIPSMGIYRNMQLAQILGPIAVCVLLEVKSDPSSYEPKIHLDNLTRDFSDVRPLNLLYGDVEVPHVRISTISKPDKYLTIANKLKELFCLPLEGDMRIEDLVACLKKSAKVENIG